MRISATSLPYMASLRGALITQTVCQAAGHRSSPTDAAVQPAPRIAPEVRVRPTSSHTFDIRV